MLLSSHILEEIQGVASRILVMLAGRLAASGDYRTLRRLMTNRPHTVRVRTSDDRLLVTIQEATDPRFAARLPKRLWLANVTNRLRDRSLRLAGPKPRPALLSWRLAA